MKSSHSDRLLLSPRPAWVALARVFSNLSMDRCRWRCGLRFLIEDLYLLFFSSNPKDSKNSFIHRKVRKYNRHSTMLVCWERKFKKKKREDGISSYQFRWTGKRALGARQSG